VGDSAPDSATQACQAAAWWLHDRQIRIIADGDDRYEHTVLRCRARIIDDAPS